MSTSKPRDRRALAFELEQVLMDLVMDALSGGAARRLPEVARYAAQILALLDENPEAEPRTVIAPAQARAP